jgi:hypothetical protein
MGGGLGESLGDDEFTTTSTATATAVVESKETPS